MSRKRRRKRRDPKAGRDPGSGIRESKDAETFPFPSWFDQEGQLHCLVPMRDSSPEVLEEMTRRYRAGIRNSEIWDDMVRRFGEKKAEELLDGFRVELRDP